VLPDSGSKVVSATPFSQVKGHFSFTTRPAQEHHE
jgi:hypothetical protein